MEHGKVLVAFAGPLSEHRLGELGEEIGPPLGALSIAGRLQQRLPRLEVRVVDGVRHGNQSILAVLEEFEPDVLLLSFYTPCAEGAYHLAREAHRRIAGLGIALGGPHASAMPTEGLLRSPVDAVAVGEGEDTAVDLCRCYQRGDGGPWRREDLVRIDGLVFRDGEAFRRTSSRAFIRQLDSLPFPARELVDMSDYHGFYISRARPETNVIWSRGCPYSCTFCSNEVWKTSRPWVRARSPSSILEEIEQLQARWGIQEVFDNADEFNHHIRWATDVCRGFVERDLGVVWKTQVRAAPLPPDLVSLMARAGCWCVHVGIESANPDTLRGIGKGISASDVRRACGLLKDHGIKVHGLFMLFNVWEENGTLRFEGIEETERTLEEAGRLSDDGLIDFLGWSITTPYPGSPLYLSALRHGLIPDELIGAWDQWLRSESFVMRLPGIDHRDQARMKTRGSALRARRLLLSGNIRARDAGFLLRKLAKLVQLELSALLRQR